MNTIWENGEDDGSRTSALLPETDVRSGEGENKSMLKFNGVTKSLMNVPQDECNSSSSSSIGDDSDADGEDVESRYSYDRRNDDGFDDAIQALEQALPIRRGISTFYNGKSKSFTSLADVWPTTTSSSIQDIAKPENAYTRKRRNHVAFKLTSINTRRISKKPKSTKLNFAREEPDFTKHATPSQTNNLLALRSFSMVNLRQTKIGNC